MTPGSLGKRGSSISVSEELKVAIMNLSKNYNPDKIRHSRGSGNPVFQEILDPPVKPEDDETLSS